MNLTELTVRLLVLFLPGIIAVLVVEALTAHRGRNAFRFALHAYLLGCVCYLVYGAFWWTNRAIEDRWQGGLPLPAELTVLDVASDEGPKLELGEVALATLIALPIAILFAAAINHSWLHRVANRIHASKRFGEIDVWHRTFNSPQAQWATVRDMKNNLVFEGYVTAYSDVESPRELLLADVDVLKNDTGRFLYRVDSFYVCRDNAGWTIEFREPSWISTPQNPKNG